MRWITNAVTHVLHAICMVVVLCAVLTWMVLEWLLRRVPRMPRRKT